jgi:hypothetical protein
MWKVEQVRTIAFFLFPFLLFLFHFYLWPKVKKEVCNFSHSHSFSFLLFLPYKKTSKKKKKNQTESWLESRFIWSNKKFIKIFDIELININLINRMLYNKVNLDLLRTLHTSRLHQFQWCRKKTEKHKKYSWDFRLPVIFQ